MIDFRLSLRQVWMTHLAGADWFRAAPLLVDGTLIARTGNTVVALDPASGKVRWKRDLEQKAGDWLVAAPGGVIVDVRGKDRDTTLIGLAAADGKPRWQRALSVIAPRSGASVEAGRVLVVGMAGSARRLLVIDSATGAVERELELKLGGARAISIAGGFVVARPGLERAGDPEPGLYRLSEAGKTDAIDARPMWSLTRVGDMVLSVRRVKDPVTEVIARRIDDLATVAWTAPGHGEELGVGRDEVTLVDPDLRPVVRDAATGAERWHGPPLGGSGAAFRGVSGPAAWFRGKDNLWIYSAAGSLLGEGDGDFSFGVVATERELYVGVEDAIVCAALP